MENCHTTEIPGDCRLQLQLMLTLTPKKILLLCQVCFLFKPRRRIVYGGSNSLVQAPRIWGNEMTSASLGFTTGCDSMKSRDNNGHETSTANNCSNISGKLFFSFQEDPVTKSGTWGSWGFFVFWVFFLFVLVVVVFCFCFFFFFFAFLLFFVFVFVFFKWACFSLDANCMKPGLFRFWLFGGIVLKVTFPGEKEKKRQLIVTVCSGTQIRFRYMISINQPDRDLTETALCVLLVLGSRSDQ